MEEKLVTSEKKCPECGSINIVSMGSGHATGSGQPMKKVDQFQFKCEDCKAIFWYSKNP